MFSYGYNHSLKELFAFLRVTLLSARNCLKVTKVDVKLSNGVGWPPITPRPVGGITHVHSLWLGGDVRDQPAGPCSPYWLVPRGCPSTLNSRTHKGATHYYLHVSCREHAWLLATHRFLC